MLESEGGTLERAGINIDRARALIAEMRQDHDDLSATAEVPAPEAPAPRPGLFRRVWALFTHAGGIILLGSASVVVLSVVTVFSCCHRRQLLSASASAAIHGINSVVAGQPTPEVRAFGEKWKGAIRRASR